MVGQAHSTFCESFGGEKVNWESGAWGKDSSLRNRRRSAAGREELVGDGQLSGQGLVASGDPYLPVDRVLRAGQMVILYVEDIIQPDVTGGLQFFGEDFVGIAEQQISKWDGHAIFIGQQIHCCINGRRGVDGCIFVVAGIKQRCVSAVIIEMEIILIADDGGGSVIGAANENFFVAGGFDAQAIRRELLADGVGLE